MQIQSKLPEVGTTIFATMSALAAEHEAINLSQGFPNFDCDPKLHQLVYKYMKKGKNQYAPMGGVPVLTEQLCTKIEHTYDRLVPSAKEITITAGATQAIFTAVQAFIHSGDEVILLEPAYDCYKPAVELCGGQAVPVPLTAPDYQVPWDEVEDACNADTRMIMVNHPHNPTGKCWTSEDLDRLTAIAEEYDLIVLSDEVYEHILFDGREHQSVLRRDRLYKRSLAVFSFGKTFHNTGWKIGYAVGPEALMEEFRKVHQFNVFSVNTPVQYALAEYLRKPSRYEELPDFYQRKRDFFRESLEDSRFRWIACEGTYFNLCDYSDISDKDDLSFAMWLTKEKGVAAIPVSSFYSNPPGDKVVRFCFAKKRSTLKKAGQRLREI